jgi:chitosanase
MSVTHEQRRAIDAIVCIHETGRLPSPEAYSTVALLHDGAGLSVGKHQSTDRANSLDLTVKRYIESGGIYADALKPYYVRLVANETATVDPNDPPQWVLDLMEVLRKAGTDPLMQEAQDYVFDQNYYAPAAAKCRELGLVTALAHLIMYDVHVQSGAQRVDKLRNLFPERPPSTGGSESLWVQAFLKARGDWLRGHSSPVIQKTIYRVNWLQKLVEAQHWDLAVPFKYGPGIVVQ